MSYKKGLSNLVAVSKDIVSLLRDAGLVLIVIIMITYPKDFRAFMADLGLQKAFGLEFDLKSYSKLESTQVLISNLQSTNNDLVSLLKKVEDDVKDSRFKSEVQKYTKNNIEQRQKTKTVQKEVTKILESNTDYVAKLSKSNPSILDDNSRYSVGLQTYGMPPSVREELNIKLTSKNYRLNDLSTSYTGSRPPSWFAGRSTVFYYAASAKPSAEKLSEYLNSITNVDFEVRRGAGLGVDPEKKDSTLFVHYIK